jgi:hypothetical protein
VKLLRDEVEGCDGPLGATKDEPPFYRSEGRDRERARGRSWYPDRYELLRQEGDPRPKASTGDLPEWPPVRVRVHDDARHRTSGPTLGRGEREAEQLHKVLQDARRGVGPTGPLVGQYLLRGPM